MRKFTVLLTAAMAIAACSSGANTTRTRPDTRSLTPDRVVQAYVDAFNRGDVASAVAQFAPDAKFSTSLGGCAPCVGQDAIQQKLSGAAAAHSQIAITNPRVSGDTLTAQASITAPNFPPGVHRAFGTFTATVRNGKIVDSSMDYDRSDPETAALFAAISQ
jgi:hypothetical protein